MRYELNYSHFRNAFNVTDISRNRCNADHHDLFVATTLNKHYTNESSRK